MIVVSVCLPSDPLSQCLPSYLGFSYLGRGVSLHGCSSKVQLLLLTSDVHFQGKPFNITVIQVYAPTSNAEEAEVEQFYEDLQDLLELTHKKRYPFHHRGLECKSRKSRDTWINRQDWPWTTKWSSTKANRFLPRKCTGHSKCPFQQHKRRFYTWTSPDGQHQNQIDYIICTQRWRSAIETG